MSFFSDSGSNFYSVETEAQMLLTSKHNLITADNFFPEFSIVSIQYSTDNCYNLNFKL